MLRGLLALVAASQANAANILMLGDSMVEFSGQALKSFCSGATVHNAGIGGTTAQQWADGLVDDVDASSCGGTPDYIWLSVGGNDALETGCTASKSTIKNAIIAAINAVKARYSNVPIVMTGYCMASSGGECPNTGDYTNLMEAIPEAAQEVTGVTIVDSTDACGGSISSWSTQGYFQDFIHLNNRGYCKVFTQSAVQSALGCGEKSYDCDAASCEITGLAQHCGDSDMTSCEGCSEFCSGGSGDGSGSDDDAGSDDDHDDHDHDHDDDWAADDDDGKNTSQASFVSVNALWCLLAMWTAAQ